MKKFERIVSVLMLMIMSLSNVATPLAYAAQLGKIHFDLPLGTPLDTTTLIKAPHFFVPDQGSVLAASTTLFSIGNQKLDLGAGNSESAIKRTPPRVEQLNKKVYQTTEDVAINVLNPDDETFTTAVQDASGKSISVPVTESNAGPTTTVDLAPSNQLKPGLYKVTITDAMNHSTEQDFTWGVLALNTDKSIYHVGEKGDIAMAVLNNNGDMVCDAQVNLEIFAPDGQTVTLSTQDKTIVISDQCQKHDYSLEPDYAANYTFLEKGLYQLQLTATTSGGSHTITDSIQVTNAIPFDVQRISATRIYPPNTYPMLFNITANRDFDGTVTETVPDSFVVTQATQSAAQPYSDMQTVYLNSNDPAALMSQQIASNSGGLVMPFHGDYPITQGFGAQLTDPVLQAFYIHYGLAGHDGIDFGVPMNTPLYAVDSGDIIWSGPGDYGTMVTIKHSWGQTYYGHMTRTSVSVGQHVEKGQLIGYSGMTGEATGPHLHFGMKPSSPDMNNGYYGKVDALPFLPYGHQAESLTALGPLIAPDQLAAAIPALANTVLGAADSATPSAVTQIPTPSTLPSGIPGVSPITLPTPIPTAGSEPTATPNPSAVSPTPTGVTPTGSVAETATPTPTPAVTIPTAAGPANTNFSVLGKEIRINEQIANSALTDKVKILTWNVKLKKGETTTLGYAYQAPKVSPQFYLLGPAKFYSGGNERVVFQENRQWQIASDDVGIDWYTNTTGNKWNGYSWQYRKKLVIDHTKVTPDSTGGGSQPTATYMNAGIDEDGVVSNYFLNNPIANTESGAGADCTSVTIAAHTGPCSIQFNLTSTTGYVQANSGDSVDSTNPVNDSGSRISAYYAIHTLPGSNETIMQIENSSSAEVFSLRTTSAGVLQLVEGSTQIGSNGTINISAATWTRISVAYTITNATTYSIKVYVNGTQSISANNGATLPNITSAYVKFGILTSMTQIMNLDDIYTDSGTDLSDIGDVRITNKRAFANGASNPFTTFGTTSGYGSGNAPFVNKTTENTLTGVSSTTSSAVEEYTIEGASVGYVDVSSQKIIAQSFFLELRDTTANCTSNSDIIYNGSSTVIPSVISTTHTYYKLQTTSTYPSGNTAIGFQHCNNTDSNFVHEAGVDIAYTPATSSVTPSFIESGGDETGGPSTVTSGNVGQTPWDALGGAGDPTLDSTNHETGPDSWAFSTGASVETDFIKNNIFSGTSGRISTYVKITNYPSVANAIFCDCNNGAGTGVLQVGITTSGATQVVNSTGTSITGTNGPTLALGKWYRLSLAWNVTSTSNYSFKFYVNGQEALSYSQTVNGTALNSSASNSLAVGWLGTGLGTNNVINFDDIYTDNGSDLSDPGDIHVTAKLPIANGASNGYSTNGSAGGTACSDASTHCQYVNERPNNTSDTLSTTTNGARENFTIQSASQGDVDVSNAGLLAYQPWVTVGSSNASCIGRLTSNGTDIPITIKSTTATIASVSASTSYPSGNTAVGLQNCGSGTGTLYEAGVQIAYTNNNPASTLTNFPVLVSFTSDSSLNAHAQSNGNDIIFTDSTGRNALSSEVESFSAGTLAAWVQIPTLSSTTDTIIYMYYGNPSAASGSSGSNTWNGAAAAVWHFSNSNGSGSTPLNPGGLTDSTANANTLTNVGSVTEGTGEISQDAHFSGTNNFTAANNNIFNPLTAPFSGYAWINTTAVGSDEPIMEHANAADTAGWQWYIGTSATGSCNNNGSVCFTDEATDVGVNAAMSNSTWYQIAFVKSGTGVTFYKNGSSLGTISGVASSITTETTAETVGSDAGADTFDNDIDELEFYTAALTPGWIQTEYNSQNSPGTFIPTVGSQETDIYAPTLSGLMRHGEFFNSQGQIQPFVF